MKILSARKRAALAHPSKAGWVQVGLTLLSAGLSYLAGSLLNKRSGSPIEDDQPTTLAIRGSYTNWFVGIRRVGPVFCWAGDREIRKEKAPGGKGGGAPDAEVFYEAGWHVLGVGPMTCLHSIDQSGKVIMNGPITSDSHPSGTLVDLGAEGSFYIYWGEDDQPPNLFLGDSERVSISSRWPGLCYVVWNKKRLSTQPVWPNLRYELESRPTNSVLTGSDGWYAPVSTLTGETYAITGSNANSDQDVGYLEFPGDQTANFKPKSLVALSGNAMADDDYEILRATTVIVTTGTLPNGFDIQETRTRLFLVGGTDGADSNGTVETYSNDDSNGANVAHAVAEMLFADYPRGLQIDPTHLVERWDTDSLEDWGAEAEAKGWRASILATQGETCEALLGAVLQDHGVMVPIDTASGNLYFQRVRKPSGTLPAISASIYSDTLPEIEVLHGEWPADRLLFTFSDRAHNYGDMTIAVGSDGQAGYYNHVRARKVPVVSTVFFDTAASLGELRSPEELSTGGQFQLKAGREARELIPGQHITAAGFDQVLLVEGVDIDTNNEEVGLTVLPGFYGVDLSSFIPDEAAPDPTIADPEQDEQFVFLEIPEQALGGLGSDMAILIPHVRDNAQTAFTSLWLSRDNSTYNLFGTETLVQAGGTLTSALSADGPSYLAQGPEYTELGPDNGTIPQDYSGDLPNWGAGRQLCVIASSAGIEICFLQRTTITGGSTRRLDGLLRARFDTRKLEHPSGAEVYIFDYDGATAIEDLLLEPGEDLYVKTQPGTTAGQVNLSAVPPYADTLVGKGQVPIQPDYVSVKAPYRNSPCFQTGDDITISWALSSGTVSTGAGAQSAGTALGDPEIPGTVSIELLTTGDVVQLTTGVDASTSTYEITNAALVAAFGSEPSAFKVRVTHVANGRSSSASPSLTITRI